MMHEDEVELIKEGIMEEYDNYFLEDSGIKLSEKAQTHLSRYFIITVTQVSTRHDFFIWLRKLLKASNEYSHVLKEFWDYCKVYERNIFLDSDIFYVRNTIKDIYPIGNALTFFLEILEDFLEIRLTFQETYDINSLYALIDPK